MLWHFLQFFPNSFASPDPINARRRGLRFYQFAGKADAWLKKKGHTLCMPLKIIYLADAIFLNLEWFC